MASHRLYASEASPLCGGARGGTAARILGEWHIPRNRVNDPRQAPESVHTRAHDRSQPPRRSSVPKSRSRHSGSSPMAPPLSTSCAGSAATSTNRTSGCGRCEAGARASSRAVTSAMVAAVSPDGRHVAFVRTPVGVDDAVGQAWVHPARRRRAGGGITSLKHGVGSVRWSPDGGRIAGRSGR